VAEQQRHARAAPAACSPRPRSGPAVALIGSSRPRVDGLAKVKGESRYGADQLLDGLLHARLQLSPHARARITSVDVEAARAVPGVVAVMTGQDVRSATGREVLLATELVRYAGHPVAVALAETEAAAADAVTLVRVDYEPLPPVITPTDALSDASPRVLEPSGGEFDDSAAHGATGEGNVFRRGDTETALRNSAVRVSGSWRIPPLHPAPLEPHAVTATAAGDGAVTVWTPTQGIFLTRSGVAGSLGLKESKVRVIPTEVGGAFGAKMLLLEPLVCLLAARLGRPVQLVLTRQEEFLVGSGSAGYELDLELGADAHGRLQALRGRIVVDKGAGRTGAGAEVATLLAGGYRIPNHEIERIDVATNRTPAAAYRAPGAPQACLALESALDELAERLRMDPIELRLLNCVDPTDLLPDGEPWGPIAVRACLEAARRHPLYSAPPAGNEGTGIALGVWRGGVSGAEAECRIESDGSVAVRTGAVDISGTSTSIAMLAAEILNVPLSRVRLDPLDSESSPNAGPSAGSRIVYTVGPAVTASATELRHRLLQAAAEHLEAAEADLELVGGRVAVRGVPDRSVTFAELAAQSELVASGKADISGRAPMATVHLARVRVDPETGAWRIVDYAAIQDVGRAINPAEVEGQVHGGALQGLARVLGEELAYDAGGQPLTASFADYALPTVDQVPGRFEVELVEEPSPLGPFGAKGAGEPPIIPAAAAVVNAIAAATGVRLRSLPVDLDALVVNPRSATYDTPDS
jgi:CO/xanthine dehydrogenase Mo-binding subunit